MAQKKPITTRKCSCARCRSKRQRPTYSSLVVSFVAATVKQAQITQKTLTKKAVHLANQAKLVPLQLQERAKKSKKTSKKVRKSKSKVIFSQKSFENKFQIAKNIKKLQNISAGLTAVTQHKLAHFFGLSQKLSQNLLTQFWQIPSAKTVVISKKSGVIYRKPVLQTAKTTSLKLLTKLSLFIFQQLPLKISHSFQITTQYLASKNWPAEFASYKHQISEEWREISTKPVKSKSKTNKSVFARPLAILTNYKKTVRKHIPQYATFLLASLLFAVGILSVSYGIYSYVFVGLPEAKELTERKQIVTTRILDRNDQLLYRIYEDENRTLVPLSSIPTYVKQATIAIEDQDFYNHHGFSFKGIVRALIANLEGKPVQGGSTITQQLVKNRLLTPERTLQRKIREVLLSVIVDGSYAKDQILEMYLNTVAYGGATYGIEEAAQTYFGKPATQLTLAESAMLAGLPAAPSVYNPFGTNPEFAYARQREVLHRMVVEKFITQEEADTAEGEVLQFRRNSIAIKAPHFVMYVRQLLAEKYGEDVINQGGLEVRTTLDLDLQNATQDIVTTEMANLARLRINNGAALVTNPTTGEILSMVGSKDYFDFAHDGQVNVTLRPRQPGSSIKALTYAVALEKGKNTYSIIDDTPITYNTAGSPPYSPKNYDGKFHGKVTLRQALGSSYNIPAVKMLAEVGINTVIDKAQAIGVTTWNDRNRFGLSLTLGGGEVLMTELSEIYGTFANNGYTEPLNPILEIKNSQGEVLYRNTCALDGIGCVKKRNFDPRVAYQISDVLSDNNARTPAFGPRSVLNIPGQQVAVKTGTTNNLRDNWTIGYTSDILVAVWVGNNDNTPMSYVASGITGASPIWNSIIRLTLDDENPHTFKVPDGLVKVNICERTGTLTCQGCPRTVEAYYVAGTEPTQACNPAQFRPKPKASPNPGDPTRDMMLDGVAI